MYSECDTTYVVGFPIRKSADQSLLAAPHGLSQPTTSFIASQCQGIHQMLLRYLITIPKRRSQNLYYLTRIIWRRLCRQTCDTMLTYNQVRCASFLGFPNIRQPYFTLNSFHIKNVIADVLIIKKFFLYYFKSIKSLFFHTLRCRKM